MNTTLFDRINFLLFKHRKMLFIIAIIYYLLLIAYDLIFLKRPADITITTYILALVLCIFVWFGVKLVVWVQIKNNLCTDKLLNVFIFIFIIFSTISSSILSLEYFINGFIISAFICPTAFISAVNVQKYRKNWLNNHSITQS